ncbi:MAG: hypothetical protein Q9223_003868 [Gallowayella weberi]
MVKALDNSLVDLDVMPGKSQDGSETEQEPQQGGQGPAGDNAPTEEPPKGITAGAQDAAGGIASATGGGLKGILDTAGNTVGALGGGLANTAGSMYTGATKGVQKEQSGQQGKVYFYWSRTGAVDSSSAPSDNAGDAAAQTTQKTGETLQNALDGATYQGEGAPSATEAAKDTGSKALETTSDYDTAKRKTAAEAGQSASDAIGETAGDKAGKNARSVVDTAENMDETRQEVTAEVGQQTLGAASNAGSKVSDMTSGNSGKDTSSR